MPNIIVFKNKKKLSKYTLLSYLTIPILLPTGINEKIINKIIVIKASIVPNIKLTLYGEKYLYHITSFEYVMQIASTKLEINEIDKSLNKLYMLGLLIIIINIIDFINSNITIIIIDIY